jgi:hypothetical protein
MDFHVLSVLAWAKQPPGTLWTVERAWLRAEVLPLQLKSGTILTELHRN